MDNYTLLMEEFHLNEQDVTNSQGFVSIIDQLINAKQQKNSVVMRKKEEKAKLLQKIAHEADKLKTSFIKVEENAEGKNDEMGLQEIKGAILKKQLQNIQKEVVFLRKGVKQMQEQFKVFVRKESDIKELRCTTERDLQTISVELKNAEISNFCLDEKHQKILEQLQNQKNSIQQQNKFLSNELSNRQNKTKNANAFSFTLSGTFQFGVLLQSVDENTENSITKEEIYTKSKVEENLRSFYKLSVLKKNWVGENSKKKYQQCNEQAEKDLFPMVHFWFSSKKQIVDYYLRKLQLESIGGLKEFVLSFYDMITQSIDKLEATNNQLNMKMIEMKQEYEKLKNLLKIIKGESDQDVSQFIQVLKLKSQQTQQKVRSKCRLIFQIIERKFSLTNKLTKVKETLDNITKLKTNEQDGRHNKSDPFQFNKKIDSLNSKERRPSKNNIQGFNNLSLLDNLCLNKPTLSKTVSIKSNKSIGSSKKLTKNNKNVAGKKQILFEYEQILFRNPRQVIFNWYESIKNGKDAYHLLQTVLENDIYRIFYNSTDYDSNLSQLQNQTNCYTKSFKQTNKMLFEIKDSLFDILVMIFSEERQMMQKINDKKDRLLSAVVTPEARYVIQSKGYYRRDNFKLLEKMQLIQMKKKGLYIPYRYGVTVEQEMLTERKKNQENEEKLQKTRELSERKSRLTVPHAHNFISSYREKLNKADRKIRDMLNNADSLKIRNKLKQCTVSRSSSRLDTSFRN